MSTRVNIDNCFFTDIRVKKLGIVTKTNRYDAMGRLVSIWAHCYEHQVYRLTEGEIELLSDSPDFAEALVQCDLAEYDEGVERYRIRGLEGRIEWLAKCRANASKGGQVRAERLRAKRDADRHAAGKESLCRSSADSLPSFSPTATAIATATATDTATTTDTVKKKKRSRVRREAHPLVQLWNDNATGLAQVREINSTRARKLNARWKENGDETYWRQVIQRIVASDFCTGSNDNAWKANFNWILKPESHIKVMEGLYDNRDKPGRGAKVMTFAQQRHSNNMSLMAEVSGMEVADEREYAHEG